MSGQHFHSAAAAENDVITLDEFRIAVGKAEVSLKRAARRLTRNDIDADDLVQDTLLRGWMSRRLFEKGTNLQAWLLTIQRNLFLSQRRRAWRQVHWESDAIEQRLVSSPSQEDAVSLNDVRERLEQLPEVQRRAVEMIAIEGRSYREAAADLEMSQTSLRSLVSRTRARLAREPDLAAAVTNLSSKKDKRPPKKIIGLRYGAWKASGSRMIG